MTVGRVGVDVSVLFWGWGVSAAVLLAFMAALGQWVEQTPFGLLIDDRERYSLARFNIVWWSTIIVSLCVGVAAARFTVHGRRPLGFDIPTPVLSLFVTASGTTVASSAVKSYKNRHRTDQVGASFPGWSFLGQMLLQEEGAGTDRSIDVGKFQAFVITVLLGLGYVLTSVYEFTGRGAPPIQGPRDLDSLPALDPTFVVLLAVSAAGYVGAKTVPRAGQPPTSVAEVDAAVSAELVRAAATGEHLDGPTLRRRLRASPRRADPAVTRAPGDVVHGHGPSQVRPREVPRARR